MSPVSGLLADKVGLVIGVANDQSIAAGCAEAFRRAGAELVLTHRLESRVPDVSPIAQALDARLMPLNIESEGALEAVFDTIRNAYTKSSTSCFIQLHSVQRPICMAE